MGPEDELFPEDEEVTDQIDEEDEIENAIMMVELSDDDHDKLEAFKLLRKDVLRFSSVVPEDHCRCVNVRVCAEVANSLKKLQDVKPESNELNTLIEQCIAKTDEMVQQFRAVINRKPECNHQYNDLTNLLQEYVYEK